MDYRFKKMKNEHLGIDLILDNNGEFIISPSGDLAVTFDGRQALLQDVKHLLETMPDDLFSHSEYGTGLLRLLGNENIIKNKKLLERSISDALIFNQSISYRIDPNEIEYEIKKISDEELTIQLKLGSIKEILSI